MNPTTLSKTIRDLIAKDDLDSNIDLTSVLCENASLIADSLEDTARLEGLLNLVNIESIDGNWQVTLNYNNQQDAAQIIHDGKIISECGDIDKEPEEQFRQAIDAAITTQQENKG